MPRSDLDYLHHILDETYYLQDTTKNLPYASFLHNETLKRAFVRSIEIIGEASKNLSEGFKSSHEKIDWRAMARMRDKLIHGA